MVKSFLEWYAITSGGKIIKHPTLNTAEHMCNRLYGLFAEGTRQGISQA